MFNKHILHWQKSLNYCSVLSVNWNTRWGICVGITTNEHLFNTNCTRSTSSCATRVKHSCIYTDQRTQFTRMTVKTKRCQWSHVKQTTWPQCIHSGRSRPDLLLVLELVGQPIEALVQSVATGGTRRLDVPVALAQRMQAEFVCDLGCVHCVRQILHITHTRAWRRSG